MRSVLGIRDILVRIRIPGSVTLTNGSGSGSSWIRLLSSWILRTKKIFFKFFITCPKAHHLQSKKLNFVLKFCFKYFFAGIISVPSTHFWEKGRIRIRIRTSDLLILIRKAQKHSNPADPVPQHKMRWWNLRPRRKVTLLACLSVIIRTSLGLSGMGGRTCRSGQLWEKASPEGQIKCQVCRFRSQGQQTRRQAVYFSRFNRTAGDCQEINN